MSRPARIEVDPARLFIEWDDGVEQVLASRTLRAACPCAACRAAGGEERTRRVVEGLLAVTIGEVRLVGEYALAMAFAPDSHRTGIFPFSLLRTLPSDET